MRALYASVKQRTMPFSFGICAQAKLAEHRFSTIQRGKMMGELFRTIRFLVVWGLIMPLIVVASCNAILGTPDDADAEPQRPASAQQTDK